MARARSINLTRMGDRQSKWTTITRSNHRVTRTRSCPYLRMTLPQGKKGNLRLYWGSRGRVMPSVRKLACAFKRVSARFHSRRVLMMSRFAIKMCLSLTLVVLTTSKNSLHLGTTREDRGLRAPAWTPMNQSWLQIVHLPTKGLTWPRRRWVHGVTQMSSNHHLIRLQKSILASLNSARRRNRLKCSISRATCRLIDRSKLWDPFKVLMVTKTLSAWANSLHTPALTAQLKESTSCGKTSSSSTQTLCSRETSCWTAHLDC